MGNFEREQARLLALYEEVESATISSTSEMDEDENSEIEQLEEEKLEERFVEHSNSGVEHGRTEAEEYTYYPFYLGKNQSTKWFKIPICKTAKTRSENIITQRPGVRKPFIDAKSLLDCWKLFITDDMMRALQTNKKIREKAFLCRKT